LSLLSPKQLCSARGRQWSGGRTGSSFPGLGADLVITCDFDPSLCYGALKARKGLFFPIVFVTFFFFFSIRIKLWETVEIFPLEQLGMQDRKGVSETQRSLGCQGREGPQNDAQGGVPP
jgi:hypothetical protein